ncbi:SMP-30/gluconolactonase/LRE family protein [Mesorhizobium sp. CU2]|uniref:SMP-30/gluconolactonase/LRE family protein n=1 Tax=unclassified Mesorhizobium TaxID=325217 RepID=UPI00112B6995|nr:MULTISPECIES: SMP-30/gluconolactonase/LRE family protein [unclassified Mesorhizobium]TPN81056.1 SMP-30/gluconolactonase/LRE family protein [Mesorhizobium sp. CU3]TPO09811.1 SMP-30/gluconolactonase/LRE family protein [Mesorhizobium sp. CU2]
MPEIRVLVDCRTILGESPIWDVDEERLYWIDSFGKRIYRSTITGTELKTWDVPGKIGSMALRARGGAILSLESGFHAFDLATGKASPIADPEADVATTRLNDGKVDRQGRFVAGSMDMDEANPKGSLYRVDVDLSIHKLEEGIVCSNGPCWSVDGKTFYFADTWADEICAYDYNTDTGSISNKRPFASFREGVGAPDGATIDEEGFLWSAVAYGGELRRFAPDGSLDRRVEMPVRNVTSLMFGGPNLDVLYVTSAATSPLARFPDDGRLGGSLFEIRGLGVRGVPERRFLG